MEEIEDKGNRSRKSTPFFKKTITSEGGHTKKTTVHRTGVITTMLISFRLIKVGTEKAAAVVNKCRCKRSGKLKGQSRQEWKKDDGRMLRTKDTFRPKKKGSTHQKKGVCNPFLGRGEPPLVKHTSSQRLQEKKQRLRETNSKKEEHIKQESPVGAPKCGE